MKIKKNKEMACSLVLVGLLFISNGTTDTTTIIKQNSENKIISSKIVPIITQCKKASSEQNWCAYEG